MRYMGVVIGVSAALLLTASLAPSAGAAGERPVVHVLAPPAEYALKADPLAAEAALRLVAAEGAVRHGAQVRYWPVESLSEVPKDAYPRVEVAWEDLPGMRHLRLGRRGDTFTFLGSADGKTYIWIGERTLAMPARAYVGLSVSALPDQRPLEVVIRDATLNGKPFSYPERADFGEVIRPSEVVQEGSAWTFRTRGARWRRDLTGVGPFVYKVVEGDFDLEAAIERATGERTWRFAGVVCRGGLDHDAPLVGTFGFGEDVYGGSRSRECPTLWWHWGDGAHVLKAMLRTGPDRSVDLGRVVVSVATWERLGQSIRSLADQAEAGLVREGVWPAARAAAVRLTEGQEEIVAGARGLILEGRPASVLLAGRRVEGILAESPASARVRRAAALGGAVMACHDPFGYFHDRGRYLAGPVSAMLLAQRLEPAATAEDRLSDAWVVLACGYPKAAGERLAALPDEFRSSPEGKALGMFVSRDYRSLTKESALQAAPLEQLAWAWAVGQCGRDDLADSAAAVALARSSGTGSGALLLGSIGAGPGDGMPVAGSALAYALEASSLLADDRLPVAARRAAADVMARAFEMGPVDDLRAMSDGLTERVVPKGLEGRLTAALPALMDLYAAAARETGPGAGPRAALPAGMPAPAEAVALRRAWVAKGLYFHARYLNTVLGDPQRAGRLCEEAARGFQAVPETAEFFRLLALAYAGKENEAAALAGTVLASPFGRRVATVHAVARAGSSSLRGSGAALDALGDLAGRGAWDWLIEADASRMIYRAGVRANTCVWLCLGADDRAAPVGPALRWLEDGVGTVETLRERMPYAANVVRIVAGAEGPIGWRIEAARQLIQMAPADVTGYAYLADAYARDGRRDQAIATLIQAADRCPESLTLSNCLGMMAWWLVEEKRPEEAVTWAERAARGGTAPALKGLALALAANGRRDEALAAYRRLAHRYVAGAADLAEFLVNERYAESDLLKESETLVQAHGPMRDAAADAACQGLAKSGRTGLLLAAFKGPFAFLPADERTRWLVVSALTARNYADALRYARDLEAIRPLQPAEALWAYAAAALGKDAQAEEKARKTLRQHWHDRDFRWHARYVCGETSAEELLNYIWLDSQKVYAHWLVGVEADRRGQREAALEAYRKAAAVPAVPEVRYLAERWAATLSPPATRPSVPHPAGAAP